MLTGGGRCDGIVGGFCVAGIGIRSSLSSIVYNMGLIRVDQMLQNEVGGQAKTRCAEAM